MVPSPPQGIQASSLLALSPAAVGLTHESLPLGPLSITVGIGSCVPPAALLPPGLTPAAGGRPVPRLCSSPMLLAHRMGCTHPGSVDLSGFRWLTPTCREHSDSSWSHLSRPVGPLPLRKGCWLGAPSPQPQRSGVMLFPVFCIPSGGWQSRELYSMRKIFLTFTTSPE